MNGTSRIQLRPRAYVVRLHPDVEDGEPTDAVFATDLGAVAAQDKSAPIVYREPDEFFRVTYPPDKQEKATQTVLEQAEALCHARAAWEESAKFHR